MPLYRSRRDSIIGGVCGGIAEALGWSATRVRVLYVLFSVLSYQWETRYRYLSWEPDQYMIISAEKDKKFERANPKTYAKKVTTDLDCEIVFSNGEFIQYPEQCK